MARIRLDADDSFDLRFIGGPKAVAVAPFMHPSRLGPSLRRAPWLLIRLRCADFADPRLSYLIR